MPNITLAEMDEIDNKPQSKPKTKNITLAEMDEIDRELQKQPVAKQSSMHQPENRFGQYPMMAPMNPQAIEDVARGIGQGVSDIFPNATNRKIANEGMGSEIGKGIANTLSTAIIPGKALGAAGKAMEMIPGLNKVLGGIRKTGTIGKTTAEGAIGGAMITPEDRIAGAELGGGLGAGLGTASKLTGSILNKLNPFKTNLSPEQLANNLRIAGDTQTPLGDVIQSPRLKKGLENFVAPIPGSGVQDTLHGLGQNIVNKGTSFVEKLRGGVNEVEIPDKILSSLERSLKESKKVKNELYGRLDKVANESNFKPTVSNFMQEAKRSRGSLDSIKVLENDPELRSLYNKISRYEEPLKSKTVQSPIVNKEGVPFEKKIPAHEPTLKEATLLKSTLSDYAKAFQSSSDPKDRLAAGTLKRLAASLDRDIKISMKKAPENVRDMYEKTNKYYKESFLPNLDKEIYRYTMGKGDPDTLIKSLVKGGRNKLSDKVLSKLSEKDRHLIGYDLLKKSVDPETGQVNPKKINSILKNYSSHQKEAIFGKNMHQKLNDYMQLVKMNDESLTQMYNPKTGARAMPILGLGVPYAVGSAVGGIPGGLLASGSTMLGANAIGSALTSPNVRKYVVNALSNAPKGVNNKLQKTIGAGSGLLAPEAVNVFSRKE